MYSVTSRCAMIKQPRGGYVKTSYFDVIERKDKFSISDNENIAPVLVGAAVDYLTRMMMGANVFDAFSIPLAGSFIANKKAESRLLIGRIGGLDEESIRNACKLAGFDACVRRGPSAYKPISEIEPNKDTISNIYSMVLRCLIFWDEYGPIVKSGVTFTGGYTPIVSSGDADYLTEKTLWDLKVLRKDPYSANTLQLLMYYILGKHSSTSEFSSVENIGFYNPRKNKVHLCPVSRIPSEVIKLVEHDIMGYGWSDEDYENFRENEFRKING